MYMTGFAFLEYVSEHLFCCIFCINSCLNLFHSFFFFFCWPGLCLKPFCDRFTFMCLVRGPAAPPNSHKTAIRMIFCQQCLEFIPPSSKDSCKVPEAALNYYAPAIIFHYGTDILDLKFKQFTKYLPRGIMESKCFWLGSGKPRRERWTPGRFLCHILCTLYIYSFFSY